MTLIFMEGFDSDGYDSGKWSTWNGTWSSTNGRDGTSGGVIVNAANDIRKTVASNATYIVGAAVKVGSSGSQNNMIACLESGTIHLAIRCASDGTIDLYRGTTLIDSSSAGVCSTGIWHYVELKATIHDSTGVGEVHVDGTQVINFSGDTRNGGTSGVINEITHGAGSGNNVVNLDDIYYCDDNGSTNNDFLGDCVIETLYPDGNGNYSDFTGSDGNSTDNYLLVDDGDTNDGDTTYVEASTAGDTDSYTFDNTAGASTATVFGVQVNSIARHTGGGGTYRHIHRRSTTDTFGNTKTPPSSYGWDGHIYEQDGAAGPGAWTMANIDSSEFGVDIVS